MTTITLDHLAGFATLVGFKERLDQGLASYVRELQASGMLPPQLPDPLPTRAELVEAASRALTRMSLASMTESELESLMAVALGETDPTQPFDLPKPHIATEGEK